MIGERIPPHDLEAEQYVLSCCLLDPVALVTATSRLKSGDFYSLAHAATFDAMVRLQRDGIGVDSVTLKRHLSDDQFEEFGGYGYLTELIDQSPVTGFIDHYCDIVLEKARRRAAIRIHSEALSALWDPRADDPTEATIASLMGIEVGNTSEEGVWFSDVLGAGYEAMMEACRHPSEKAGVIDTPFGDLNRKLAVAEDDMVVVAARPSTGKTALALQILEHLALVGQSVKFFSLEMSRLQVSRRYIMMKTGISVHKQMTGYLDADDRQKAKKALGDWAHLPINLDDRTNLTVAQMAATVQRDMLRMNDAYAAIVVDHMGKVKSSMKADASNHIKLSQVSNDLKAMARRLKVPVIVLNQLNRGNEKENREPLMSDIRESGSIEEDADVIMLLHRPEREGSFTNAQLAIAKNRQGECGKVELVFQGQYAKFNAAQPL